MNMQGCIFKKTITASVQRRCFSWAPDDVRLPLPEEGEGPLLLEGGRFASSPLLEADLLFLENRFCSLLRLVPQDFNWWLSLPSGIRRSSCSGSRCFLFRLLEALSYVFTAHTLYNYLQLWASLRCTIWHCSRATSHAKQ